MAYFGQIIHWFYQMQALFGMLSIEKRDVKSVSLGS